MIRPARPEDGDAIWSILEPVIREGETYTLNRDMTREEALAYWLAPHHHAFVFEEDGQILATYYLRTNQAGGGSHVCNCGYMASPAARGRGIATTLCLHSLDLARQLGYRAMQFNFVVSTNETAVRLWQKLGFEIVGRLPGAFNHPRHGHVDALVFYQDLTQTA